MSIENRLQDALRAQDPGPDFTAAVLQRVAQGKAVRPRTALQWRLPVSLAASVLMTLLGAWMVDRQLQQDRVTVARQQLDLALAITSYELNQVQQKLITNDVQENGI